MALGDDLFDQLANDYIKAHPSRYFSLRDFGGHLPRFVSGLVPQHVCYENKHWLFELALFEWTLGQAFDAADVTLCTEQDMAVIPPEAWPDLTFTVHPSVQRLELEWNIPAMWLALTDDEPGQVTATRDMASPWLIWREQLVTRFRSMQIDEQRAFDALREGASFNDICEVLVTVMNEDDVPLRAASLLKGWLAQGLLSGIE